MTKIEIDKKFKQKISTFSKKDKSRISIVKYLLLDEKWLFKKLAK